MSNKDNKPKLTSREIVEIMEKEKGITFNIFYKEAAIYYLSNVNNYMRTASYRKNYSKIQGGVNDGKYEKLDFAYLKELSTIDMYFRFVVSKMCIDIEHSLKVKLIRDIEKISFYDGYSIVYDFLNQNEYILRSLEKKIASAFTGDLIEKYFTIEGYAQDGKILKKIMKYDDCPVWVLVELLSFGEFIDFYKFYYGKNTPINCNLLHLVRSLRNAAAHNNCLLSNLNKNTSQPPVEIKIEIQKIHGISKSQRQKNLTRRPMLEFVTLLYVFDKTVSKNIKEYNSEELIELFKNRMLKHKEYFIENELIKNTYNFAIKMIDYFICQ